MSRTLYGPLTIHEMDEFLISYDDVSILSLRKEVLNKINRIKPFGGRIRVLIISSDTEVEVEPVFPSDSFKTVTIPTSLLRKAS